MKKDSQIIKNFLTEIMHEIENIDGGCFDCIGNFVDGVNDTLEKYSLRLIKSDKYPIKVTIEEKE